MFIVTPNRLRIRMPARNEPGIDSPTRIDERRPSEATITIITRMMPVSTLFSRSPSIERTSRDLSCR